MFARLSAFVIWALIGATAVFWALRLAVRPAGAPSHAVAIDSATGSGGDLSRLLGAPPVQAASAVAVPEASSRFRLLGIVAPKRARGAAASGEPSHGGVALIAVDGKPPRAYAVGAALEGDLVLQSVTLRTVSIGPSQGGGQPLTLEIPPLAAAATGTLPPAGALPAPGTSVPVAPPYVPPPMAQPPQMAPQPANPPAGVMPSLPPSPSMREAQ